MNLSGNKLKIAFDAKRLFNNNTGLGNYSRTLVRNLQKYFPQHEYHLFTPKISENDETAYFLDPKKFIIHTPKRSKFLYRTRLMSYTINRLQPDIFHGLSHELPFGLDRKIKTLVTFHDLIYEKYPYQFGFWDRYAYKIKYKSSAFRAQNILAISQSTQQDLARIYGIENSKIHVVYQSCHEDFQLSDTKQLLLPEKIQNLTGYFLYVGSIIERKGLLDCVTAYNQLPLPLRRPFVIVGSSRGEYAKSVRELIKKLQLENNFIFLNNISNCELVKIYDACSIFLYPSIYEGFGIPVIESLFRKKPVITTSLSSLPEAAGDGGILVSAHDPRAIAEAVITYLTNQQVYDEKAQKGFDYVNDKFSAKSTAENLMRLYHGLVDESI